MKSFWMDFENKDLNFSSLDQNIKVDVCIIGAGIFGLSTGYYLSKKGLKVAILDKGDIATKVTGNTTGKITSQHGLIYKYLVDSLGFDSAKQYLNANQEAIKNIEEIIENENIDCDFIKQDNYVFTKDENQVSNLKDENEIINKMNFNSEFVTEIPIRQDILGAIKFPNQAQFHPRKYCFGLANSILKNSGRIYTNTIVYDVNKEDDYYVIKTKNNEIKSKNVVLASHYPFKNAPGFYFSKMYQSTSYIIAVDTKTEISEGMYINVEKPTYSFRTVNKR